MKKDIKGNPEWIRRLAELEKSVVVQSKLKLQNICKSLKLVKPNPVRVIEWGKGKWRIVYNIKAETESIKSFILKDIEVLETSTP